MTTSRSWLIVCVYAVGLLAGTLLLIQHWVHIPAFLPYLVFLACPLMHLFMHRGHGRHHEHTPGGKLKRDHGHPDNRT
jgi:hypothetical protein